MFGRPVATLQSVCRSTMASIRFEFDQTNQDLPTVFVGETQLSQADDLPVFFFARPFKSWYENLITT